MAIKVQYETTAGSVWPGKLEAEIADALEQKDGLYLEKFGLEKVVETMATLFLEMVAETAEEYESRTSMFALTFPNISSEEVEGKI